MADTTPRRISSVLPMSCRHSSRSTAHVIPPVLVLILATFLLTWIGSATCACNNGRSEAGAPAPELKSFWALETIPSFHITLDDEALGKLKKEPREFVSGAFRYQDQTVASAGIRLKGHRSMRPIGDKPSFKIRFDKYQDGARLLGQRYMVLNNMVEDPTMMREILGYRLYRAMGVPAPEMGYAEVFVNDEPYGLYSLVEPADEVFLARHFDDATGNLYEGEYGCDLYEDDVEGFDRDSGKDKSRADLRALVATVSSQAAALFEAGKSPLAMDSFLAYLAVSAFLGDFDGYRHSHNYRIYHEPGRDAWYFLPWGIDRTFKKNLSIYDSEGLLAKRCFRDAACRLAYVRTMRTVIERFEALQLEQGVRVVGTVIDEAVRRDPRRDYDRDKMRQARQELIDFIARRPGEVRDQLSCLDADGNEVDRDGDGHGCMDCSDSDPAVHPGAAETCNGADDDCSGLADDAPACACPAIDVDGTTFYLCDLPMPWTEAAAFCEAQGHTLARVDTEEQSRRLYQAAAKREDDRDRRWWIGLSDRGEEERFQWHDGAAVELTNWSRGEPDNDGCNQDCAALKQDANGKWHDTHCGQHEPFICR
jgi:hypothetical protein